MLAHYTELVRLFPNDERARTLLGNTYFGRQEYETAIKHYEKATSINPSFSQPYNQLGYAYRFIEKFDEAEKAFKKYTELIPGDPNPYDSYAELLIKIGRFDESIRMYEKALSLDPNFVASHVGIGNNYLAMGKPEQARAAFAKIATVARNNGERRLARFWTAASYVHEGATDKALDELQGGYALAEADGDGATMSGDLTQMGDVLREAGRTKEALAKYEEAVTVINKAKVPEEVKEATRRTHLFEEGRVAAAAKDIATAKAKLAEYTRQVAARSARSKCVSSTSWPEWSRWRRSSLPTPPGAPARQPAGSENPVPHRGRTEGRRRLAGRRRICGQSGKVQRAELQLRLCQERRTETGGNLGNSRARRR